MSYYYMTLQKSLSSFLVGPLQVLEGFYKVSLEPSLLTAEKLHFSQPFLTGQMFNPSDRFCGPPLDPLEQLHVFSTLRALEMNIVEPEEQMQIISK